jgi:TolB protein
MNLPIAFLSVLFWLPFLQGSVQPDSSLRLPEETHFGAIRQLTFGGENAEAYFSFDESRLILQSTHGSFQCDQEYILDLTSGAMRLVSTGKGRTTCGYFLPGDTRILYSSTHHLNQNCPPRPDYSKGYVWPVSPDYDITDTPGYDAEATVSPVGDRIVFTSMRRGDLDLYSMALDGTDVVQLTNEVGYDGGAFFSSDGTLIVYRGWHYTDSTSIADYKTLLAEHLVRPSRMELFVMRADGRSKRQITNNGAANFAPFFHPDNRRIIFASNLGDPKGRNFDLYLINLDGTGLERVTFDESFDGFPMFTRDGKKLVFASNRNARVRGETNIFLADWKE